MERNEMIKKLMEKAYVTNEEAQEVLEKCNWDLLDAIIYLERNGKVENNETTTIIEVKEEEQKKEDYSKKKDESYGGIGEVIGRIFKYLGKIISKGNKNYFEIKKDNEKPIRISLTISIILLILFMPPTVVLLIIGLFCGYKYSVGGPNMNCDGVNDVFEKVSESADTIKKDFKKGYEEN
ncbi:DUF4342 domain-containing protein [Clostridium saudiense]|uniref:DUF4342 domain-containing protein n=1 Tax=Clostridium saudiense TaxID=1414720 RepID=UPI0018A95274|nr:DUF4342 domain-containing protein [Clostridium saudiense]